MPVKAVPTEPEVPLPDSVPVLIFVTSRLSVSPPVSFEVTPDPAFTDNVASSFTLPVSFAAAGPTPLTVIVSVAVSVVPAPSLTV